ncbi:MAG: hypothetical protein NC337_06845 [Roseburia sp.]|nr:hypothetical protein [Roseburia sp.]
MKERQLAICDKDVEYLETLQSYLLKKKPAGFEILVFSSVSQAAEASEEEGFEILLVGESTYDAAVARIKARKIFILLENGLSGIREHSAISKYQSMSALIAQVLDEFSLEEGASGLTGGQGRKARLISFFSPDRHSGQTAAALCVSELLADRGERVLYLNLAAFSGFEELLRIKYDADITDFMYFVLKHSDKLPYKLESIKRTLHGVDYLPPALDYADLRDIAEEDWKRGLDMLLCGGNYTRVVIDLTEVCQGFYHILDRSDRVYVVTGQASARSRSAFNQYHSLLLAKQYGRIIEKTRVVDFRSDWEACSADLEGLCASPIGAHMRSMVQEDEQE